eukprot:scaffold32801_cov31-Tisochrysis_lutea.AAC.3
MACQVRAVGRLPAVAAQHRLGPRAVLADDTATAIAIAMNGCNVLVTIASVILMDQAGRRALLIFSICGMAISGTLLTVTLDHAGEAWVPATCVAAIVGFVGAFGIGLGPVACLLPSELFPATQRAAGSGLAFSVLWITQFITTFVFLLQVSLRRARSHRTSAPPPRCTSREAQSTASSAIAHGLQEPCLCARRPTRSARMPLSRTLWSWCLASSSR